MARIILASASKQRRLLLREAGLRFRVEKSGYRENMRLRLSPRKLAMHLALGKAKRVAARHPGAIVIGADTIVALGKNIFGKPKNAKDGERILRALSGRTHEIITGYAVVRGKKSSCGVASASVTLRELSDDEIRSYAHTKESLSAAGAYAIQGKGIRFIRKIAGKEDVIRGLPLDSVLKAVRAMAEK